MALKRAVWGRLQELFRKALLWDFSALFRRQISDRIIDGSPLGGEPGVDRFEHLVRQVRVERTQDGLVEFVPADEGVRALAELVFRPD